MAYRLGSPLKGDGEQVSGSIPKAAYYKLCIKTSLDKNQNWPWSEAESKPSTSLHRERLQPPCPGSGCYFCATPTTPSSSSQVFKCKSERLLLHADARAALRSVSCAHIFPIPSGLSRAQVLKGSAQPKWSDYSMEEEKLEVSKYLILVKKIGFCGL